MTEKRLPEKFEEFSEARKKGFLKVKDFVENGGHIVGTFCGFTPREIINAGKGLWTVDLCGSSEETITVAEQYLPRVMCPLIKSTYGFAVSDKCPYMHFTDFLIGETTCDGKKKMYELLGKMKDMYVMQIPQDITNPTSKSAWIDEVRNFRTILEKKYNIVISDDDIRQIAAMLNQIRKVRLEIMNLMKLDPPPITDKNLYHILDGSEYLFDLESELKELSDMLVNIKEEYTAGKSCVQKSAKRILVTGCPIGGVLNKTVEVIEENGGVVVCYENCGGMKGASSMVDLEDPDIIAAVAKRSLEIGCAVISPNIKRYELLKQLCRDFNVDGVVDIQLQVCQPYIIETKVISDIVSDLGIPYMALDTDYSKSDVSQMTTRLSAFLEMICDR